MKGQVFEIAEKIGIKKDMLACLNDLIQHQKANKSNKFGPEELYFALQIGMMDAETKDNYEYHTIIPIAKAYLYGYLLGKAVQERK